MFSGLKDPHIFAMWALRTGFPSSFSKGSMMSVEVIWHQAESKNLDRMPFPRVFH